MGAVLVELDAEGLRLGSAAEFTVWPKLMDGIGRKRGSSRFGSPQGSRRGFRRGSGQGSRWRIHW